MAVASRPIIVQIAWVPGNLILGPTERFADPGPEYDADGKFLTGTQYYNSNFEAFRTATTFAAKWAIWKSLNTHPAIYPDHTKWKECKDNTCAEWQTDVTQLAADVPALTNQITALDAQINPLQSQKQKKEAKNAKNPSAALQQEIATLDSQLDPLRAQRKPLKNAKDSKEKRKTTLEKVGYFSGMMIKTAVAQRCLPFYYDAKTDGVGTYDRIIIGYAMDPGTQNVPCDNFGLTGTFILTCSAEFVYTHDAKTKCT